MTTHTVRRGETLSSIAKTYSVDVAALMKANDIGDADYIDVNSTLTIPKQRVRNAAEAELPKPRAVSKPAKANESDIAEAIDGALAQGKRIAIEWIDELLQRLRTQEANESVQQQAAVPLTKQAKPVSPHQTRAKKKGSRSKKSLNDVKEKLKEKLGKEPHVVTFNGVKLTENEKKQIVASVAVCEMNSDGFGSINADQEFVGRKFGKRGIETQTYSRIVHIGLSYGFIQFTQDAGSLGKLLQRMSAKNSAVFDEIFGGGDKSISQSLIELTTSGRSDVAGDDSVPSSGLSYWGKIRGTKEGKEKTRLSNTDEDKNNKSDLPVDGEIRGKRVQPIPPAKGAPAADIWTGVWRERFLAAGKVVDFQEVQIDEAIERYLTPILPSAKKNKVRSALGLAFITACSIRGADRALIYKIAGELRLTLPFESSEDERKCIDAIAQAKTNKTKGTATVGSWTFDQKEAHRAALLIT